MSQIVYRSSKGLKILLQHQMKHAELQLLSVSFYMLWIELEQKISEENDWL